MTDLSPRSIDILKPRIESCEAGLSLLQVNQKLPGHRKIAVKKRYVHPSNDQDDITSLGVFS